MKKFKKSEIDEILDIENKKEDEMEQDWDRMELYKSTEQETLWQKVKFEVNWNWDHYFYIPYKQFKNGIRNFWKYRKLIWNDYWWDYQYLMELIEFKIKDMESNWDEAWGCDSDGKKAVMAELLEILKEIKRLDDDESAGSDIELWKEKEKKIDELYERFGKRLFGVNEHEQKDCDGKVERKYKCSTIRILWD
jgi:hypothetical protein